MDATQIEFLRLIGAIPRGLTVTEEMEFIRRQLAKTAASRTVSAPKATIAPSVHEPVVIARSEPAIIVPQSRSAVSGPIIDCSAPPYIPDGWVIRPEDQIASAFRGRLIWTPDCVRLHLANGQRNGGQIRGFDLKGILEGQPVLPANVLDWQLEDPNSRIPPYFQKDTVFYWGTVYCDRGGDLCVRCLDLSGVGWDWGWYGLGADWSVVNPAAVGWPPRSSRTTWPASPGA